jgi:hypothetical protein
LHWYQDGGGDWWQRFPPKSHTFAMTHIMNHMVSKSIDTTKRRIQLMSVDPEQRKAINGIDI